MKYQAKDNRIKYIKYENNKGLFIERETGVKEAKADYILHVDSDDWIELKLCEALINSISQDVDLIIFDTVSVRQRGPAKEIWVE